MLNQCAVGLKTKKLTDSTMTDDKHFLSYVLNIESMNNEVFSYDDRLAMMQRTAGDVIDVSVAPSVYCF